MSRAPRRRVCYSFGYLAFVWLSCKTDKDQGRGRGGVPCVNPPMLKSVRLRAQRTAQEVEPCIFVKESISLLGFSLFRVAKTVVLERIP